MADKKDIILTGDFNDEIGNKYDYLKQMIEALGRIGCGCGVVLVFVGCICNSLSSLIAWNNAASIWCNTCDSDNPLSFGLIIK